ncbi:MAG: 50S ribosomal protein L29 [Pseudomonadales bacterium]|nr:50S ribosomal protein L29 [Pseudomonadales bacterium]
MKFEDLRSKAAADLKGELLKLRKEQFSLRMQAVTGQGVKPSDFGKVKKSIARVKTVLRQQEIVAEKSAAEKIAVGAKK